MKINIKDISSSPKLQLCSRVMLHGETMVTLPPYSTLSFISCTHTMSSFIRKNAANFRLVRSLQYSYCNRSRLVSLFIVRLEVLKDGLAAKQQFNKTIMGINNVINSFLKLITYGCESGFFKRSIKDHFIISI